MKFLLTNLILLALMSFTACDNDSHNDERCQLEPDSGPCEAYIPKYFYNQEDEECQQFIWGGCEGVVPFDTLEDCQRAGCHE